MKPTARLRSFLFASSALICISYAHAAQLYWDGGSINIGGTGNGISLGTGGTWSTSISNWDFGAVAYQTWSGTTNTAVFGGTAGTVNLGSNIDVGGLTFNTTGYGITTTGFSLNFADTVNPNRILFNNIAAASITGPVGGAGNVILSTSNPVTAGTLTLNGASATGWSGTTTIDAGMTLALAADNRALSNSTGITFSGGNLTITNTSATDAGYNRVANGAGITSAGGGTFTWTNTAASARVYAETIGSVDLVRGQLNFLEFTNQGSGGTPTNSQTLLLSGLTRTGGTNTSAVSFGSASGLNTTTNIIQVSGMSGTGSGSGQIIGPWAFYGTTPSAPTDYAVYDGSGRVLNANITANNSENTWGSAANITVSATGTTTLTGTRTLNTLRYNATGSPTLNLGAWNHNLETYGILNGNTGLTIASGGTGALTTPTGGGNLYLTPGAAAITVNAPINDNGGAVTVVKSGSNALTLSSTTSNFSGGTVINAGTLSLGTNSDANLGAASGGLTFNGTATLGYSDGLMLNSSRTVTINAGAIATFTNAITVNGVLTGSGALRANSADAFVFSNPNNDFSGTITSETGGSTGFGIDMANIGDGAGAGLINLNNGTFRWIRNTGGPTTFTNRQFALAGTTGAGTISSMGNQTLTINKDLLVTGVGAKTLTLAGTNTGANVFAGNIANGTNGGTSVITVAKAEAGNWTISGNMSHTGGLSHGGGTLTLTGTNTYSGNTNFTAAGTTLVFAGTQSISPNTTFVMNTNASTSDSTAKLLDDTGGVNGSTVSVPNTFTIQNSNGPGNAHTFIVGNNNTANGGTSSGTTTGSTIAFGTLNWNTYAAGTTAYGPIQIQGTNGYRLQINSVVLHNAANLTSPTVGNTFFTPTTANVTLGTVTVGTGNTGQGYQTFVMDGTSSDNRVTGIISNASDVGSSLRPLNVTKSNTSTWTLQGTNSYTGATTVSGGKLLLSSTGSLHASSAVTVSGGAIGGTGTVNGSVSLTTAGGIDLRDNAVGTLTLGSTLANSGAAGANNLFFDLGNGTNTTDKITVAGATTLSATAGSVVIHLNQLGGLGGTGPAPGSSPYTLIQSTGALTNGASAVLNTTKAFRQTYALSVLGNNINLTTAAGTAGAAVNNHFWKGSTSSWSTAQWYSDSGAATTTTTPGYDSNIVFAATTPANLTNTLGADFEINSLTVNSGVAATSISGNMLTIDATNANSNTAGNGITVNNAAGTTIASKVGLAASQTWTVGTGATLTVSGVITDFGLGNTLTKAGAGTLTLTGANTHTGPLVMNAGTLSLGSTNLAGFGNTSSVTFTGSSTISHGTSGLTLNLPAVQIDSGVIATFDKGGAGSGGTFNFNGALTGSGTLSFASGSSGNGTFNLIDAAAFTGTVRTSSYTTNGASTLNISNIGDGGSISHGGTGIDLTVNYTGVGTTFTTRQLAMTSTRGLTFNNNGPGAVVFNQALSVTASGAKTLGLGGSNNLAGNTFAGLIADGTGAAIGLTKSGTGIWTLSNTANSYTGATTISGGQLIVSTLANGGANSSIGAAASGAAGLVLSGGTLRYTGGTFTTNRGFTHTTGTSGLHIGDTSAASLTLGNSTIGSGTPLLVVTGAPGSTLTIAGDVANGSGTTNGWQFDPSINVTVSGVISGAGGFVRRNGIGTVTLNNDNNSYTGQTEINATGGSGAFIITSIADYGTNSAIGKGTSGIAIILGGNQGSGSSLTYIGDGDSSNRQFTLQANNAILNNGTGALTFTGLTTDSNNFIRNTSASAATRTLTLGGSYTGAANIISGNIQNNGASAIIGIAKDGPGNWTFSGTNTYTGTTVVNAGTLQFAKMVSLYNNTPASWTAANINVKAGATLAVNVDSAGTAGFNATNMNTLLTNISVAGTATAGLQAGANLGIDTSTATGGTFTQGNAIANSTGTSGGAIGLTKLGTGTFVLDKVNTYTGTTVVNAGTLQFAKMVSLYNNTPASWTAANINVKAGATLAVNVDSAGTAGFNVTNLNTLLTNISVAASATAGLQAGANLGIDTSTATGGTFTQGNLIANSTGTNGGAIGLTKLGTGTFILDKANTYTGATTVSAGVLAVNGSLANTTTTVQSGGTLQGSGSIAGSVTIQSGGILASGNSIESLATGSLGLNAGSTFAYEIDKGALPGVAGDLTAVTGNLTFDLGNAAILSLTESGSGSWTLGEKLTLISYTGTWNGGLFDYSGVLADDSTFLYNGTNWLFNYNDTVAGSNFTSDLTGSSFVTMTVIPEPRAALLGSLGLLLLLRRRR